MDDATEIQRPAPAVGFVARAAALLIDVWLAIELCGLAAWMFATAVTFAAESAGVGTPGAIDTFALSMVGAAIVAMSAYMLVPEISALRATPGKLVLGIQVDSTSGRPNAQRIVSRRLSWLLSWLLLGLGFLVMLFDPQRRTLHDRISGTNVVSSRRSSRAAAVAVVALVVVVGLLSAIDHRFTAALHSPMERVRADMDVVVTVKPALDALESAASELEGGTGVAAEPDYPTIRRAVVEQQRILDAVNVTESSYAGSILRARSAARQLRSALDSRDAGGNNSKERVSNARAAVWAAQMSLGNDVEEYRLTPFLVEVLVDLLGLPAPTTGGVPEVVGWNS